MRTFIYSVIDGVKAAFHENRYADYALLLAVNGIIFIIGIIVVFGLSTRINPPSDSSDARLGMVDVTKTPFQPQWSGKTSPHCYGPETHSIGDAIADKFNLPYEQVMTWFCSGYEFEDILLALQTHQQMETSIERLLEMRAEGNTWDEIWQQIDLTE